MINVQLYCGFWSVWIYPFVLYGILNKQTILLLWLSNVGIFLCYFLDSGLLASLRARATAFLSPVLLAKAPILIKCPRLYAFNFQHCLLLLLLVLTLPLSLTHNMIYKTCQLRPWTGSVSRVSFSTWWFFSPLTLIFTTIIPANWSLALGKWVSYLVCSG